MFMMHPTVDNNMALDLSSANSIDIVDSSMIDVLKNAETAFDNDLNDSEVYFQCLPKTTTTHQSNPLFEGTNNLLDLKGSRHHQTL